MARVFFTGGYKAPREFTWLTGLGLFGVVLAFGFTGYLLPWNALSYVATRVGVSYPEESLPLIGSFVADMIRGGEDVGATTLTRIYAAHVVVLPLLTLMCSFQILLVSL